MLLSFLREQRLEHVRWRISFVSHLLEVHRRSYNAACHRWLAQETTYLQHLQRAELELREQTDDTVARMNAAPPPSPHSYRTPY
ncbi:MAG: hypothetical protein ACAH88_07575 [Roseimicrobium sp.]